VTPDVLGAVIVAGLIVAMVGLVLVAVQPSRANVVRGAVALGLLPTIILVALLVVWLLGR
jgi:hypothetical protein